MYSKETLKNVCDFFDMHYEEIDEITIPIVRYKNGKTLPMHYRYKYETKTGIYDLDEFPFVSQTTINIIVKTVIRIFIKIKKLKYKYLPLRAISKNIRLGFTYLNKPATLARWLDDCSIENKIHTSIKTK